MKISNKLESLYRPEAYKQKEPRVQTNGVKENKVLVSIDYGQQKDETNKFSLKKVLSSKEINSLTALFGYEQDGRDELYGRNKISNVHAGMLLDVKG
jgi:hypothetical protein